MKLTNRQKGCILIFPLLLLIIGFILYAVYYFILGILKFTKEDWSGMIMVISAIFISVCGIKGLEYLEKKE